MKKKELWQKKNKPSCRKALNFDFFFFIFYRNICFPFFALYLINSYCRHILIKLLMYFSCQINGLTLFLRNKIIFSIHFYYYGLLIQQFCIRNLYNRAFIISLKKVSKIFLGYMVIRLF